MQTKKFRRVYPNGSAFAHLLGYRQIASEANLKEDACKEPLRLNDKLGVKGVEKLFECDLRPIKGHELIETNAQGKFVKTVSKVEPVSGKDITLSIDAELQQRAHEVIVQNVPKSDIEVDYPSKKISVIGLKPHTGEILLMLSYPSFDPQAFEDTVRTEIQTYLKDKAQPLYNRALLGTFPPGSVFKPMVAAAGLEEKVISPTETIQDNGYIEVGANKQRFHNWFYTKYGRTDGAVNMVMGLQRSNDIYFYKLGEKLGNDHIKAWAHTFGFGNKTGIALDDSPGLVPSDFWKRERIGEKWYLGDTYNLSIGQGYLLVTPLQMALASAVFAQDGQFCLPQLLKISNTITPRCKSLNLEQETLKVVREGMKKACESGGTGWPFFTFEPVKTGERIEVGCKTGTAQSHLESGLPHAWFTIFAPFEKPEIVLTILVEESGEGSSVAAPIAKEILTTYFQRSE
ncbi:MAG: Stage V sporulation protein D [Microgenomates bacterium OLB23]|nr:MAG: Stage V sporulation protein D [Microgenomates bacterium OLB23]